MTTTITTSAPLMGYQVSDNHLDVLVEQSVAAIAAGGPQQVFDCANPHSLAVARSDAEFRAALQDAEMLVADGVGVCLASRLFLGVRKPRIPGSSYYLALMQALDGASARLGRKARVFFLGSSEQVLALVEARFRRDYPNIELVGTHSPPFGDWPAAIDDAMIDKINASAADVLWVGMTAPKQEKWTYRNRGRLQPRVIGCIGAVFDFYADTFPRAPEWMVRTGLEWVHRLWLNPRKMWRRTLVSGPVFLLGLIRYHWLRRQP